MSPHAAPLSPEELEHLHSWPIPEWSSHLPPPESFCATSPQYLSSQQGPSASPNDPAQPDSPRSSDSRPMQRCVRVHGDGSLPSTVKEQPVPGQLVPRYLRHTTVSTQPTSAIRSFSSLLQSEMSFGFGDRESGKPRRVVTASDTISQLGGRWNWSFQVNKWPLLPPT